ncbi:MAG: hypothetical protein EAX86_12475 [Candidatus Heimdallarchaeota archaeon]|nr:hypothetical protein [Candidatus Heimdallarchaeota archaeon]
MRKLYILLLIHRWNVMPLSDWKQEILLAVIIGTLLFVPLIIDFSIYVLEEQKPEPLFSVSILKPTSSPVIPSILAQSFQENLAKLGIEASVDFISWAALGSHVTNNIMGSYKDGGYDICLLDMALDEAFQYPGDILKTVFGMDALPPNGFNIGYWSSEEGQNYYNYRSNDSENLIQLLNTETNLSKVRASIIDWQKVWYDALPNVVTYIQYEVQAISSSLYGYDPVQYPLNSIENQWGLDEVVLGVKRGSNSFLSILTTDIYNQYSAMPPLDGLIGTAPSYVTTFPSNMNRDSWMTVHFGTTSFMGLYPRIASTLGTYSDNALQYNITLRDDVYWHDGERVDAWDVAFSFQARLNPIIGSNDYSNLANAFGMDDKINTHGNYSFIVEDKDLNGFYEAISFQFASVFPTWEISYLGSSLYPEHILGDPVDHGFTPMGDFNITKWKVHPEDWEFHSMNTGRSNDRGGYNGPIGCGPVVFKEYDPDIDEVILEKFENIRWDNTTHIWVNDTSCSHFRATDGLLDDMPNRARIITKTLDSGIFEMQVGNVHILDPQFSLTNIYEELHSNTAIQPVLCPEVGWQAIWLNPRFENSGVYYFQYKGVRHAFSHLIPRLEIIASDLSGLAYPAHTPIPLTSWVIIPEEEMIEYKKELQATDGSYPLAETKTAYDDFSVEIAKKWLISENLGFSSEYFQLIYQTQIQISSLYEINQNYQKTYIQMILFLLILYALIKYITHYYKKHAFE